MSFTSSNILPIYPLSWARPDTEFKGRQQVLQTVEYKPVTNCHGFVLSRNEYTMTYDK